MVAFAPRAMAAIRSRSLGGQLSTEVLAALLIAIPLLLAPYGFRAYAANALALFLIYGLLAMSLGFIWGHSGIISFGQNAFFGIGGYGYGIIALNMVGMSGTSGLAALGGVGIATLVALMFGYFLFYGRLSDVYASIAVLVLSLVLYAFAISTAGDEWVIGVARLGGFNGLFGQGSTSANIANFQIPPITVLLPWMSEPLPFRIDRTSVSGYYLVLGVCIAAYIGARALLATRLGRVARAIRENEARAATFGYDVRFYKLVMFTISGAIAGIAGVLFAGWGRFINPDVFGLTFASGVVVNVLLGGRLTLIGGFIGAFALNALTSYLGEIAASSFAPAGGWLGPVVELAKRTTEQAPVLVQGAALIVTVLILKSGLTPPIQRQLARWPLFGWCVLLPMVLIYFSAKVACRQADFCLF